MEGFSENKPTKPLGLELADRIDRQKLHARLAYSAIKAPDTKCEDLVMIIPS
jgi:hypothetical protein